MNKLSTGHDSTLGNWRSLCLVVFGEGSKQIAFLDEQIAKAPKGADEAVIADERQFLHVLVSMS